MKKILTTKELEKAITTEIVEKIPEAEPHIRNQLIFKDESITKNYLPGIYIFSSPGKYKIVYVGDKRNVVKENETDNLREVLWIALEPIILNIALDYEFEHREKKSWLKRLVSKIKKEKYDFRRIFFAKEIELYGLFGEDFKERKQKEIDEILSNNPYSD